MPWWLWVVVGLGLLISETVVPSDFFLLFFGLAALIVGVVVSTGFAEPAWAQWLLFSIAAVGSLVFLRAPLSRRWRSTSAAAPRAGELVNDVVVLTEELRPGGVGKAELRGTIWSVRTRQTSALGPGSRCRVERVEGLTLWVEPEGETR